MRRMFELFNSDDQKLQEKRQSDNNEKKVKVNDEFNTAQIETGRLNLRSSAPTAPIAIPKPSLRLTQSFDGLPTPRNESGETEQPISGSFCQKQINAFFESQTQSKEFQVGTPLELSRNNQRRRLKYQEESLMKEESSEEENSGDSFIAEDILPIPRKQPGKSG